MGDGRGNANAFALPVERRRFPTNALPPPVLVFRAPIVATSHAWLAGTLRAPAASAGAEAQSVVPEPSVSEGEAPGFCREGVLNPNNCQEGDMA